MEASMIRNGFAVATFLFASVAFAQNEPGTITGTVTDPDKGIVVGVQVQAKHVATAMVYKTDSSRTGAFTFSQLPPGMYELSSRMSAVSVWPALRRRSFLIYGANVNPVTGTESSYIPGWNCEKVKAPVRELSVL